MPALETFLHALNQLTSRERISDLVIENFEPGQQLSDRIRQNLPDRQLADLDADFLLYEEMAAVIDTLPPSIHDSIMAVIRSGIDRGQGISFMWRPGYEAKLEICESLDTATTHGGITVLIETRYPSDPHPLASSSP